MAAPSSANNPLKSNPELKSMLDQLSVVSGPSEFHRWRLSFVTQLESILQEHPASCMETAQHVLDSFHKNMAIFIMDLTKMESLVAKGEMCETKFSVKAKLLLQNWYKRLTELIDQLEDLIPPTAAAERSSGYNKFHMGAVLVRDGFSGYTRLLICCQVVESLRNYELNNIADRQILDEMHRFTVKFHKFCDIMADLGLYEVMRKCGEYRQQEQEMDTTSTTTTTTTTTAADDVDNDKETCPRDSETDLESESSASSSASSLPGESFAEVEEDATYLGQDLVFVDMKTGGIGLLSRKRCLEERILNPTGALDKAGHVLFAEAAPDEASRSNWIRLLCESPQLNFGFGNADNKYDNQQVQVSEAETIHSIWGVSLKKNRNRQGEELIFIDRETGEIGELSRQNLLRHQILTLLPTKLEADHEDDEHDPNHKGTSPTSSRLLAQEVTAWDQKSTLIEQVRVVFGMKQS